MKKNNMMPVNARRFTLIELLVLTAQHCRHFISNACTVLTQNTPQFDERGGALVRMRFSPKPGQLEKV